MVVTDIETEQDKCKGKDSQTGKCQRKRRQRKQSNGERMAKGKSSVQYFLLRRLSDGEGLRRRGKTEARERSREEGRNNRRNTREEEEEQMEEDEKVEDEEEEEEYDKEREKSESIDEERRA